jgi:hypothetical protein
MIKFEVTSVSVIRRNEPETTLSIGNLRSLLPGYRPN